MPHPDEGLIHAWLDGELAAAEAARVEALVATDPEWSAAVAEARGLVAASSRIVGALDRVPANVIPAIPAIPASKPASGAGTRWMWRAAAALVLVAGSAVVLEKQTPELIVRAPKTDTTSAPVQNLTAQKQEPAAPAPVPGAKRAAVPVVTAPAATAAESKRDFQSKELDAVKKQTELSRDKDAAAARSALADANADANAVAKALAGAGANRPVAPQTSSRAAAAPAPVAEQRAVAGAMKAEAKASAAVSCFEQRQPPDSAGRIIRLDAASLADSVRLERLTLRGDTLAAVHTRLIAVRARCQ